jgi:hypothetical protein
MTNYKDLVIRFVAVSPLVIAASDAQVGPTMTLCKYCSGQSQSGEGSNNSAITDPALFPHATGCLWIEAKASLM